MIKKLTTYKLGIFIVISAIVISLLAVGGWFFGNKILYFWDAFVPLDSNNSFDQLFNSWREIIFPGAPGAVWGWLIYIFSIAFLEKIFSSISLAQEIVYVSLIFFSIINFYLLIVYIAKTVFSKTGLVTYLISFVFSVIYTLNLYTFYSAYFMFNPEGYILAFFPLNILALLHFFPLDESEKLKNQKFWICTFFLSLFLMSPGFVTYIFFVQYIVWISIFLVFYFLFSKNKYKKKFLNILLFFLLIILANWWWFFPSLLNLQSSYAMQRFTTDTTAFIESSSKNGYLLNALRLTGSSLMNSNLFSWTSLYFDKNLFNFVLFFFPFLILFLLFKIKVLARKNILLFIFVMFLVSLFLVKLGNPPLAGITVWAFKHIPFFDAFRDAYQKAGLYYIFSYFILSFIGFNLLVFFLIERKNKVLLIASYILLFAGVVAVTGPFFLFRADNIIKIDHIYNSEKITFNAKTQIPKEYYDLKKVLEKECVGKTTIIIPRGTAITNAVWEKYGTSYIGQDILSHLVNCNLISAKISENDPDAFTTVPYLLLQNNDFNSFKNYLLQNDISLVLIRKDNIPYGYTNYVYLSNASPALAMGFLNKDNDFKKTFENDFFTLYALKSLDNNYNYGFSLPTSFVYTNSSLNSEHDYVSLSKQLTDKKNYLVINKNADLKKYSSSINLYAPVANCVGCVKISSASTVKFDESFLRKLKDLIKQLIGKNSRDYLPQDQKISYSIIDSSKEFSKMMEALEQEDTQGSKNYISSYLKKIENIEYLFKNYKANFFDLNNKNTEIRNFLEGQNEKLSDYLNFSRVIKDNQIRGQLYLLLSLQNSKLAEIEKTIWETDFKNKIYRMRLDIPKQGKYVCTADNYNSGLKIEDITLGNFKNEKNSTISAFLSKGNYPISISYSTDSIIKISSLKQKSAEVKEISLGNMPNGLYKMSFSVGSVSKQKIAIAITKNMLNPKILKLFGSSDIPQNDFTFIDRGSFLDDKNYEKYFSISSLDKKNYYLYLFSLNPQSKKEDELEYKDIFIERAAEGGDIQFFCKTESFDITSTANIKIIKESPVKYKITIPKGETLGKFLVFNQTYGSDWEAFEYDNGKKITFPHFTSGYANAWFIDNHKSGEISVVFNRQSLIIKNFFLTIILFAIVLFFFLRYKDR